jgi:hypothetical protein
MTTRKQTAQKPATRSHFTDDLSSVTGLAQLIAALMNHPLIPVSMYNALGDEIVSLDTNRIDDAEHVEAMLRNHFAAHTSERTVTR